jgi:hypothetical protein
VQQEMSVGFILTMPIPLKIIWIKYQKHWKINNHVGREGDEVVAGVPDGDVAGGRVHHLVCVHVTHGADRKVGVSSKLNFIFHQVNIQKK